MNYFGPQIDPNQQQLINSGQMPGAYAPIPPGPQAGPGAQGVSQALQGLMAGQQAAQGGGQATPGLGTATQVDPGMSAQPQQAPPAGGANYFGPQAQGQALLNQAMQGGQGPGQQAAAQSQMRYQPVPLPQSQQSYTSPPPPAAPQGGSDPGQSAQGQEASQYGQAQANQAAAGQNQEQKQKQNQGQQASATPKFPGFGA